MAVSSQMVLPGTAAESYKYCNVNHSTQYTININEKISTRKRWEGIEKLII